ncbi:hypothetical protein BGZ82_010095, partial [Podila clonocystis]
MPLEHHSPTRDFEQTAPSLALPQFPPANRRQLPSLCPNAMHIPNRDSLYDPPIKPEQLTEEEFNQTWSGIPGTIKIGVLLPFTDPDRGYRTIVSRISLSVLRMAIEDMNNNHVIPGLNLSLVVRDSQRPITGTNATGGAAAISATTRLLAMEVGAAIGDIASELTQAEALMTSSLGVPQCSFATYSNDVAHLKNFPYLFRSSPGVLTFYDALVEVIDHYGWKRISVLYTSDVPGLLGEKRFTLISEERGIDVKKVVIPITESQDDFAGNVRSALRTLKFSDTRIHVLVVARPNMISILDMARDYGLFTSSHVWLTAIDISDSIARLRNPSDFNGLIMADVLWNKPGLPAYDAFVTRWTSLDPQKYPSSGGTHLTWHETFAYTCVQVIAEGYKGIVESANALTNPLERDHILWQVLRGKRSPDMTLKYLGSRSYDTPVGKFQLSEDGNPMHLGVSILSFQNTTSVQNGNVNKHVIDIFNPIHFKDGSTKVPGYVPDRSEVHPNFDSPFGISMIVLTTILQAIIVFTIIVVIWNRENIIIKSASPLFCVLELIGISVTLCWIYLRIDAPGAAVCRLGLMLIITGLTINLSALVVKNYRIYRIFNSASVINHAVSNMYLLRVVSFPVIITLFLSLLHVFIHYLEPKLIRTSNSQVWMICSSDQSQIHWSIIIGFTPVLLNVFGMYLAFKTRNVTKLWNEARAIAVTIYLVCFFIVIIVIVQAFPTSQYSITYHVTMVSVYVACLLEYVILFYPKLRNLFLQKRGLYVSAGRDETLMDSILGGGMAPNRRNPSVSSTDILHGEKDLREGSAGDIMTGGGPFEDSRRGSAGSTSNDTQNPNISDLVSSYPFGQLNGEYSRAASVTSPVHMPMVYGQSSLMNRGLRRGSADQRLTVEHVDLSDPQGNGARIIPRIRGVRTMSAPRGGLMKRYGSDTVTQGQRINDHASKDAQPCDLHEMLMATSNGRRSEGMLTADAGVYLRSGLSSSFMGMDPFFRDSAMSSSASEYGGRSRENSADYGGVGMGRRHRLIPPSRSPKQNPLQLSADHPLHTSFMSARRSIRETKMDSYTVTVPVQRQRWYILRVLAQWRMSKIIFVPYSKVLVIIDLETEKSASLIVHSIEQGYSEEMTQRLTEKRRQSESDPAVIPRPKKTRVASQVKTDPVEKTESFETVGAATLAPTVPASMVQPGAGVGLGEIVVSGPHPSVSQVLPTTVVPNASSPQTPTGPGLNNKASDKDSLAPHASFTTSRANSNQTITPTNPPAGETGPRSSMRRLSALPIINNVRKMSLNFDMDIRNMDGMLGPPVVHDIESEMAVESDYVIRIISIHNECWKVQLPDQETMERWIDIGRQIKDENWITTSRPLLRGSSKSIANSRRPDSGEAPSAAAGSGSGEEWTSAGDGQRPMLGLPPLRTRSSSSKMLHPLQTPDETDLDTSSEPIEVQGYPQRIDSDITNSSRSSNDTEERQMGRERAAKMNQKLRESSKANKLFKSLRPSGDPSGSQPSVASGALTPFISRFEQTKDLLRRASSDPAQPRRASHLNMEIFPGSDNTPTTAPVREVISDPTSASTQSSSSKLFVKTKISPDFGSTIIQRRDRVQSFEDRMDGTELDELDEFVDDPMKEEQFDEIEHTNLKDILAETRVAYTDDQHAIYDTENHRRHRYFGSLQYNYDKDRFRRMGFHEADQEFPESPEWHLTSSDLPDLELKHGLTFIGESYFDGRHHSVGVLDRRRDAVRFEDLTLVPTVSVTEPGSAEQQEATLEMEEKPKDLESPATVLLPPMLPKFDVGRQDTYKDANTTEGEASPVQAQPSPDTDSELRRAVGQAKSHWGDNGGSVGAASNV